MRFTTIIALTLGLALAAPALAQTAPMSATRDPIALTKPETPARVTPVAVTVLPPVIRTAAVAGPREEFMGLERPAAIGGVLALLAATLILLARTWTRTVQIGLKI